ncbi:MAG: CHAT domain-containing protein [Nitrospira sp.]
MVAYIYGEQNSQRSASATFAHFVEVCGALTVHDRKKRREGLGVLDALCKALGWYFPLMAKFRVKSLQELIYKKYPYACPYCRKTPHVDVVCKTVKGTAKTVSHHELAEKWRVNQDRMPTTLDDWQRMFQEIYPRSVSDQISTLGLFEELGELAEAIRVFDRYPKYFCGEAADVFSYLMGIANELSLRTQQDGQSAFSLQVEFFSRYPGLCVQCGYQRCKCPPIPEATVGRLAKELDIGATDDLFRMDPASFEKAGKEIADTLLLNVGGYKGLLERYPFDRGAINNAVIELCLRLAEQFEDGDPIAKSLRAAAITASSSALQPGSRGRSSSIQPVISTLKEALAKLGGEGTVSTLSPSGPLPDKLGQSLGAVRILLASCSPDVSAPLGLQTEERTIKEAIQLSKYRDHIVIETLPAATIDDLRRALLTVSFEIIHFSGHGSSKFALFEGGQSGTSISIESIVEEVGRYPQVRCLVLNSCFSLQTLNGQGLNFHIIGMQSEVGDQAAIEFSRGFYDAIGAGKTIDDAIMGGKSCVKLKGLEQELPLKVIQPKLSSDVRDES